MTSRSTFDLVLLELERHLSPINARGALERAVGRLGLQPSALTSAHVPGVVRELRAALQLFVDPKATTELLRSIEGLGSAAPNRGGPTRIDIRSEQDVPSARSAAKALCDAMHARSFAAQKVVTIVSEVARNIASYSVGGFVEMRGDGDRLRIEARDRGPGIRNLDEILAGRYRSRTGLGLGILGVKRLSDRFDITSGSQGTEIAVEVRL